MLRNCFWLAALMSLAALPTFGQEIPERLRPWLGEQAWKRDVEGPILSLGAAGAFDDQHIFAPAVIEEEGKFTLWYCGSQGDPGNRVFRLGLASSDDGKTFEKYALNPVFEMADQKHSVLTPALLRDGEGRVIREEGKLRMWFASATLGKGGLHTLHEATSEDGIAWSEPSGVLLENAYSPSVLKTDKGYEMWYCDVTRRPWIIRYATSADGRKWDVAPGAVLTLSQDWENEIVLYPSVLKVDGAYLMWYGSYDRAIRRETTAIGFAASVDGVKWHKHPGNPVIRPEKSHAWESNYVGNGCVMRLADGSFRYWYSSRTAPPFRNLYFALGTVHWAGPAKERTGVAQLLPLPPREGNRGALVATGDERRRLTILEVTGEQDAIARIEFPMENGDLTFIDLFLSGISTEGLRAGQTAMLEGVFLVEGNKLIDTTCGKRSLVQLRLQSK
jgi:predicted GH43/DUF377 family glycosyl hydrolase